MHILLTNDDGPPSEASPFIKSLVKCLSEAGHELSICLPHTQKSWIGKAHLIGHHLTPSYYRPDTDSIHSEPRTDGDAGEEWVLVDGTPAACSQIGLYHMFKDKPKVDLVISGPNFGRNSSAVYALSSGTLGAALEAALLGYKSIGLSYAYKTKTHDWDIVNTASALSTRIIEHLYKNWPSDGSTDLYSINVPLDRGVETARIQYTHILQNTWTGCYSLIDADIPDEDPNVREKKTRDGTNTPAKTPTLEQSEGKVQKKFKWAPNFSDVEKASRQPSAEGSDAWALMQGWVSVTPMKANYVQGPGIGDELKLEENLQSKSTPTASDDVSSQPPSTVLTYKEEGNSPSTQLYAFVDYSDDKDYVQPLIESALRKYLPDMKIIYDLDQLPSPTTPLLSWAAYEALDFSRMLARPDINMFNAYVIRKALIRKHYLKNTAEAYLRKVPSSVLQDGVPLSVAFEVDYAEFLDEAIQEEHELLESMAENEGKAEEERQWWILKPGMSDRGQGIRLFGTMEQLQAIFDSFEGDEDEEEEDGEGEEEQDSKNTGVVTSTLRHFVAQIYVPPLLLESKTDKASQPRKFHIRTYVLAVGAITVYVYKPMLALFAATPYSPPHLISEPESADLSAHLTNTCLQTGAHDGSVIPFWSLDQEFDISRERVDEIFKSVCEVTAEVFKAAVSGGRIHFQPVPNAFELFGFDYLVDEGGVVKLLEVNAFPDFKQTGDELKGLVGGLFEEVVKVGTRPFFGVDDGRESQGEEEKMVKVVDIQMGGF